MSDINGRLSQLSIKFLKDMKRISLVPGQYNNIYLLQWGKMICPRTDSGKCVARGDFEVGRKIITANCLIAVMLRAANQKKLNWNQFLIGQCQKCPSRRTVELLLIYPIHFPDSPYLLVPSGKPTLSGCALSDANPYLRILLRLPVVSSGSTG